VKGHRVAGGRCAPGRGGRYCISYSPVGQFFQPAVAGRNRQPFDRPRLRSGFYRASLVAREARGVDSRVVRVWFRVVH
jgi:hypothetical protein